MSIYQMCAPAFENTEVIRMLLQIGLNLSEVTAGLLVNRGIAGVEEARAFLNPSLDQLHNPFDLAGMDQAAERIRRAAASGEKITVYGDYDADGITSSSVLFLYLKSLSANVDVYIPSRQEEGYGLHREALLQLMEQGTSLVITVDCGITAIEEVGEVKQHIDIIVTDHHTPGTVLPDAYAVINPKVAGQAYPFKELAGVGVTAKLVQALGGPDAVIPYLDLIAVGTIADIVPLMGENRVFAALGIRQINQSPRPGIAALLKALSMEDQPVDSAKVSYSIAPCLNAAGRMTTFHGGFDLLTASQADLALSAAIALVEQNNSRRETERQILEAVRESLPEQVNLAYDRFIAVAGEGWHPGVIGIVASRITEQYHRPCVVISLDGDEGVGSARSIKGFDLYSALSTCRDLFTRFGGHEQAAGLSIRKENIPEFRRRICACANGTIDDETLIPHYIYDGQITPENISPNLINEMEMLAPFGCGNPAPRFLVPSAVVENSRLIGKEANHIKLALALGQRSWDAVGFGLAEMGKELHQGCKVSLLTSLKRNEWKGVSSTQFQIHSLKRVYRDRRDLEDLLASFYFKLFDVFFTDFMYNGYGVPQIGSNVCPDGSAGTAGSSGAAAAGHIGNITVHQAADLLKGSMVGTAVFVNTLEAAACILQILMKQDMLDRVSARYHAPSPADGIGSNAVILVPDRRLAPDQYYRTLITPAVEEGLFPHSYGGSGQKDGTRYLFDLDGTTRQNEILTNSFDLTRTQLASVYKWLRRIVPGRDYWPDAGHLLLDMQDSCGLGLNGFQLRIALEIFRELEFMTVDSDNQSFRIRCAKNPANRQLEESRLYMYHRQWLASHGIKE